LCREFPLFFFNRTGFFFISSCGFGFMRTSAPIRRFVFSKLEDCLFKVRFIGKVFPTFLSVNAQYSMRWDDDDGWSVDFHIKINGSRLKVDCTADEFEESRHFLRMYLRARDFASAYLDLATFQSGKHLHCALQYWITPEGDCRYLYDTFGDTSQLSSAVKTVEDMQTLLPMVTTDPQTLLALRDLIRGVMTPHLGPIDCARALEAIRYKIAPGEDRKKAWAELQARLRVEQSYLELITGTSTNPRHGNWQPIDGPTCHEIAIRTWTVMNRFLELKKRGLQSLPEGEFPVLS
jgi:hypothetical protein